MEVILKIEEQTAVDEVIRFLKGLSEREQREVYNFIQGMNFAKRLSENRESA
jgi:hypothetical protein